jgi:O-antigen ligase
MIFLFFFVYFAAFLGWRVQAHFQISTVDRARWLVRQESPRLWIIAALSICAVNYGCNYSPSTPALMFISGAVLGQGVLAWAGFEMRNQNPAVRNRLWFCAVFTLILLLALASVWSDDYAHDFEYQGRSRWTGPWGNPNLFGLLMAAGVLLAIGLLVQILKAKVSSQKLADRRFVFALLCGLAAVLMGRGLFHSYSRGAWLGTACGWLFLTGSGFWTSGAKTAAGKPKLAAVLWLKKNWATAAMAAISLAVVCFWHFRETDWHPAHRAFSAVNAADFSSRNRVAAWEGALQIAADHPWLGSGWSQPEPLYENYYLPPKLNESLAIQMNDYLLLGASLGIPALLSFGLYLWLSLTWKSPAGDRRPESAGEIPGDQRNIFGHWSFTSLQTICRAGAIVLLVGFWFDGGLFKLPTAATFWILLEMGGICTDQIHQVGSLAKNRINTVIVTVCETVPDPCRQVLTSPQALPWVCSVKRHVVATPAARRALVHRRLRQSEALIEVCESSGQECLAAKERKDH